MTDHVDIEALQELKEVMEDEFNNLVNTYLQDSVVRLDSLKDALGEQDPEAVRKAAHSFKGSSGNIGAANLAELCRQLEELGKEGTIEGANPIYEEIVSEYAQVKSIMESML